MQKKFEWIGFIICLVSVLANGIIRGNGDIHTIWERVTFFSIFAGGSITIITFLFRKFGNKENSKSL